jgi:hypothetical protein
MIKVQNINIEKEVAKARENKVFKVNRTDIVKLDYELPMKEEYSEFLLRKV